MNLPNLFSGLLFFLLGLMMFFETRHFPQGSDNIPGPQFWPSIIASGLAFFGVLLMGQGFLAKKSVIFFNIKINKPNRQNLFVILAMTGLYILVWLVWSFFIPTLLFLFGTMYVLHPKTPVRLFCY